MDAEAAECLADIPALEELRLECPADADALRELIRRRKPRLKNVSIRQVAEIAFPSPDGPFR